MIDATQHTEHVAKILFESPAQRGDTRFPLALDEIGAQVVRRSFEMNVGDEFAQQRAHLARFPRLDDVVLHRCDVDRVDGGLLI